MKTVLKPIVKMRDSYEHILEQKKDVHPMPLDLSLLSNPFLKGQDKYKAVIHELTLYNKRVAKGEVSDEYEALSFDRLYVILGEISNMASKEDMMGRLAETGKWWADQRRIIKQRKDLGLVKYKTDKKIDRLREYKERMAKSMVLQEGGTLPNEIRYAQVMPFQMNYRTAHKEMEVPIKRLHEYKRKIINISEAHPFEDIDNKVKEKVTYPRPKKVEPHEEIHDQINPENLEGQPQPTPASGQPTDPAINSDNPNPNANPEVPPVQGAEDPNKPAEDANQDFGGGLGQQPGEAQEEPAEDEPQDDKLAPRNKIYTWSIKQREQEEEEKTYSRPYLFYRGHDNEAQRRMQQRTIRQQQLSLQLQRQQQQSIQRAHEWAAQKSRVDRDIMFKLESKVTNRSFAYSFEEPPKREMLAPADERKFGLSVPVRNAHVGNQISLDVKLPQLAKVEHLEKEIRKDRLKSLKSRFSTILNIKESAQIREKSNGESMCLTLASPQKRNFSMILEEHSLQRQKANELQEIQKIKESLGKQRININIRTLAQALVPDSDSYRLQAFASPPKLLPNNPFFVEPKKKKKK